MRTSTVERIDMEQPVEDKREAPRPRWEKAPRWELAECTCPDFCERDHELD